MVEKNSPFLLVYLTLLDFYGDQRWWPADDSFEIMIGAILTQNTSWTNVEKAITQLKQNHKCDAESLAHIELDQLGQLIRSSGYFNQKAQRLKRFAEWYISQGGYVSLAKLKSKVLRSQLLDLNGIGDETADDICLYAFNHPTFVIDSYTRRLFTRLALINSNQNYRQLQNIFHHQLPLDYELYQQYHALIVEHAKHHCRRKPLCTDCPLEVICKYVEI